MVPVNNSSFSNQETGNCTLSTAPNTPGNPNFGSAFATLQSVATSIGDPETLPLIGYGNFQIMTTISVSCGGVWAAINPAIIAVKVGTIH
jgi:hypothetical protein